MIVIKTKDFILRPIRMNDAELYFESQQDKYARKGFMTTPKTLSEAKSEIQGRIKALKEKHGITFAIEIDKKYAGYVEIHELTERERYRHICEHLYNDRSFFPYNRHNNSYVNHFPLN